MRTLTLQEFREVRGGQTAGTGGPSTTTTSGSTTTSSVTIGVNVGPSGSIDGVRVSYRYSEGGSTGGTTSRPSSGLGADNGIVQMEVEEINRPPAAQSRDTVPADLEGLY